MGIDSLLGFGTEVSNDTRECVFPLSYATRGPSHHPLVSGDGMGGGNMPMFRQCERTAGCISFLLGGQNISVYEIFGSQRIPAVIFARPAFDAG